VILDTIQSDVDHSKYAAWTIKENPDYDTDLGALYDCGLGAQYIKELILAQYETPLILNPVSGSIADFRHLKGIYYIALDNTLESHYCVIVFRKEDLTIYTSYGGHIGFNITHHNKQKWVDALLAFDTADVETQFLDYFKLWGIKPTLKFVGEWYIPSVLKYGPIRIESLNYTKLA